METQVGDLKLVFNKVKDETRICKCCGEEFTVPSFVESEFCNRCYPIVVKELFNPENDKLTCKEFVEKMKNKVKEPQIDLEKELGKMFNREFDEARFEAIFEHMKQELKEN